MLQCRGLATKPRKAAKWPAQGKGSNLLRRIDQAYGSQVDPLLPHQTTSQLQTALDTLRATLKNSKRPLTPDAYEAWAVVAADRSHLRKPDHLLLAQLFDSLTRSSARNTDNVEEWTRGVALALYMQDQRTERHFNTTVTVTKIAPWIWDLVSKGRATEAVAFWDAIKAEVSSKEALYMPASLLNSLVAAHAHLLKPDLLSFLIDFIPHIRAPKGATHFIESGQLHPSVPDRFRQGDMAAEWIKQVELAILFSRSGNEGMHGRVRRWADRKLVGVVERAWQLIKIAAGNGKCAWLKIDWPTPEAGEEIQEDEAGPIPPRPPLPENAPLFENEELKRNLTEAAFVPLLGGSFLLSFLRLKMREEADDVWKWMHDRHLPPTKQIWHDLILGQGRGGNIEAAQAAFNIMKAPKTPEAMGTLARAYLLAGQVEDGMKLITKMLDDKHDRPVPAPVLNRIFGQMLQNQMVNQAWTVLHRMPVSGEGCPSIYTINIFLKHSVERRRRSPSRFEESLRLLQTYDVKPNNATYGILLAAFLEDGKLDEAERLLQQMTAAGIVPNDHIYSSLVHFCLSNRPPDFERALDLLAQIEAQKGFVHEVLYSDVIRELCNAPDWQDAPQFRSAHTEFKEWPDHMARALWLFKRLPSGANAVVYNSLIGGFLALRTEEGVAEAVALYRQMRDSARHRGPPASTYLTLLKGLVDMDDVQMALEVVEDMERSGFVPESALLRLVNRIKHRI